MHEPPTPRDPVQEMEEPMKLVLFLETSQPSGTSYRIGVGCYLPPALVSMVLMAVRLF